MSAKKLILLVEQQHAIWDKGSDVYKDRVERDQAWWSVGRGFCQDWDEMSKEEQMKKLNSLKLKWKNMKDAMIKSLQSKSGDAANKKKKYLHFDALSFILTAADKRRTSGNYDDDACGDEDDKDCGEPSWTHDADSKPTSPTKLSTNDSTQQQFFKKPRQPANITPFRASQMSSLDGAAESLTKSSVPEDADRLYLMSLLPDYKNLNQSKKWEFRQYVANFFQNVYQATPTTNQPPYSINHSQQWSGTQPRQ